MELLHLFKAWYTKGYYEEGRVPAGFDKRNLSTVRFAIEYFTLFLDRQIPPLPAGVPYGVMPAAKEWRREVGELADAAWSQIKKMYKHHDMKKSTSVGVFKRRMQDMDGENNWPEGPLELGPKPPGKRLRNYTELLGHQKKRRKEPPPPPPLEPQEPDELVAAMMATDQQQLQDGDDDGWCGGPPYLGDVFDD
jgi:hypothetical protein